MLDLHPGLEGEKSSRLSILVLSPPDLGVLGGPTDEGLILLESGVVARLRCRTDDVSKLVMVSRCPRDFHFLHFSQITIHKSRFFKRQVLPFATNLTSKQLVSKVAARRRVKVIHGT